MIDLLLDVGAVHRLVRLATTDSLTAPLRDALIKLAYRGAGTSWPGDVEDWTEYAVADASAPPAARWITCRWCFSVSAAFGVVALRRLAPRAWAPVATALALSSASTLLAGLED